MRGPLNRGHLNISLKQEAGNGKREAAAASEATSSGLVDFVAGELERCKARRVYLSSLLLLSSLSLL